MTSNTAPPLAQSNTHGSTFQAVFDGASRQSAPSHGSTDLSGKPEVVEKPHSGKSPAGTKASHPLETRSSSDPLTEASASAAGPVSGERSQPISAESSVTGASAAISPCVVQLSLMPANPYINKLPIASAMAADGSVTSIGLVSPDAKPLAGTGASSSVASKAEKAKVPGVHDNAGLLAALAAAVVDPKIAPVQIVLNGQGNGREQGDGWSGTSAKTVDANAPKGTHAMAAEPLAGGIDGNANAKIIPSGLQLLDPTLTAQGPGESLIAAMDIPLASGPWSNVEAIPAVGKATQKGAFDTIVSAQSDPPILLGFGMRAASGSSDASLHGTQSDGQASQSSKIDPAKPATVTVSGPDSGAIQLPAQILALHVASHETAATPHTPTSIADSPRAAKASEVPAMIHTSGDEPVVSSGINGAKVIQAMGGSEMRVGMHSTEFGDISIRTTISQQQMVTQISLSHNDLSQAISAHVATVQAKLGEDYGLHASIEVNNQTQSFSSDSGNSSQQEQRAFAGSSRANSIAIPAVHESGIGPGVMASVGDQYGLDIRI